MPESRFAQSANASQARRHFQETLMLRLDPSHAIRGLAALGALEQQNFDEASGRSADCLQALAGG